MGPPQESDELRFLSGDRIARDVDKLPADRPGSLRTSAMRCDESARDQEKGALQK
jgi:hypothetical protein